MPLSTRRNAFVAGALATATTVVHANPYGGGMPGGIPNGVGNMGMPGGTQADSAGMYG